jgi:hypothetical protein
MAYNFKIGKKKIKLLTEYENVTQKVLFIMESILQNGVYSFDCTLEI